MTHPFYALDAFAKGYVEAMFFTNGDNDESVSLDTLGVERLTKASVAEIKRDCDAFQKQSAGDLRQAYEETNYQETQAGRDFWFTRQGHGVGFWDRDELDWYAESDKSRKLQDILTDACRAFGESYVEVSRGWVYVR